MYICIIPVKIMRKNGMQFLNNSLTNSYIETNNWVWRLVTVHLFMVTIL